MSIPITNKQAIIDRLMTGEQLPTIAFSLGITASAISHALSKDAEYKDAIECQLDARMRMREQMVDDATDMFSLARAKELLRHSEFRATTEGRSRWGKDTIDAPTLAPTFNVIMSSPNHTLTIVNEEGGVKIEGKGQG